MSENGKKNSVVFFLFICLALSLLGNLWLLWPEEESLETLQKEQEKLEVDIKAKVFDYLALSGYIRLPGKLSGRDILMRVGSFKTNSNIPPLGNQGTVSFNDLRQLMQGCDIAFFKSRGVDYPEVKASVIFNFSNGRVVSHDIGWPDDESNRKVREEFLSRKSGQSENN